MPDEIFSNSKLAAIYDAFDGTRDDLDAYIAIVREFDTKLVADIGCGTGSFAHSLYNNGIKVIGIDPAEESLKIAKAKPNGDKIKWMLGGAENLASLGADMAVMAGNVAQVFTDDTAWNNMLKSVHDTLLPNGYFIFEVRDPHQKAWANWTKDKTHKEIQHPALGKVEGWCDLISATDELVSFRWHYMFHETGECITSDSTLKFRQKTTIIKDLESHNFEILDIRDAPDRPKKEFVFIAKKN